VRAGFVLCTLFFAPDALAWGLQTHVFLGQWLLAAAPFADPQFRSAALRLPRLVLAGACLPDLALAGRMLGMAVFHRAHRWSTLRRLATACWDEERAIAVGYASHLLADVVAHNRFVPEHERRIADLPHVTHALCEWAMDEHVQRRLEVEPATLLGAEISSLAQAAARTFRCGETVARRAIRFLARAERTLRASRLPCLCARTLSLLQGNTATAFDGYLQEARGVIGQLGAVLDGAEPSWQPELDYASRNEAPAIMPPSAPPATTSLG
jgi:hypothetical protein